MALNAPLYSHINGLCFVGSGPGHGKKISPLLAKSRKAQVVIHGIVGKNGFNREDDVRSIQNALNHIPAQDGGTAGNPLPATGFCGTLTEAAIQRFQNVQFGAGNRIANGIIEPDCPTINQINELFLQNTVDTVRLPTLIHFIGRANQAIHAAVANLTAARPFLSLSRNSSAGVFNRTALTRLLNRHFDIDHQSDMRGAFEEILHIYSLMRTAIFSRKGTATGTQAGVGGTGIFVIDPEPRTTDVVTTAYAFPGGFHQPGGFSREVDGLRFDQIYIGPKYDKAFDERKVRVILHELAHFVGKPSDTQGIIDHGYGLVEDPRMVRLTPRQRVLNADTYANFALEAFTGHNLTRWE